ncbi:MAG: protein kinase [Bacteroidota bacterium]
MKIEVVKYRSLEMHLHWQGRLKSIEVEEKDVDSGAFGTIYICNRINEELLTKRQAVKLFNGPDEEVQQRFRTITELQSRVLKVSEDDWDSRRPIESLSFSRGLPQVSFEGVLEGQKVWGYICEYFEEPRFLHWNKMFMEDDKDLASDLYKDRFSSFTSRHKLIFELAEAVFFLEQLDFVHGDLNPANIFFDLKVGSLILIDFESGGIKPHDPSTAGKRGFWLAPELNKYDVESLNYKLSDRWSLGILLHLILFLRTPFYFLLELSHLNIELFLKSSRWPEVSNEIEENVIDKRKIKGHSNYLNLLKRSGKLLENGFARMINQGTHEPAKRPFARYWMNAVGKQAFIPSIDFFKPDRHVRDSSLPITLSWSVSDAYAVKLLPDIGYVSHTGTLQVKPVKDTQYQIQASAVDSEPVVSSIRITTSFQSPTIKYFNASMRKVIPGYGIKLFWRVTSGEEVFISEGIGQVPKSGFLDVKPDRAITYTITVFDAIGGSTSKTIDLPLFETSVKELSIESLKSYTWNTHDQGFRNLKSSIPKLKSPIKI